MGGSKLESVWGWYSRRIAAAALAAMSVCMPAHSSMVVLASATLPLVTGSGGSGASAGFGFHYGFSGQVFPCVGCYPTLANPQVGTLVFDFTRDTEGSFQFDGLIARLTDTTNEGVYVSMFFFDSAGDLIWGFGSGDTEQGLFGGLLPSGTSVDLVRLTLNVRYMHFNSGRGSFEAEIELFGEQSSGAISEPASGLLAVLSVFILASTRAIRRHALRKRLLGSDRLCAA